MQNNSVIVFDVVMVLFKYYIFSWIIQFAWAGLAHSWNVKFCKKYCWCPKCVK